MNDNNGFRSIDTLVWLNAVFTDKILRLNETSLKLDKETSEKYDEILSVLKNIEELLKNK